jgi:anti-anti-sigma factor
MGEGVATGLRIGREVAARHTVLRLVGEVDLGEVDGLRRTAIEAMRSGRGIVVDLAGVTFVDACGLAALLWVRRAAHVAGIECRFVAPSRSVRRLAALTRSEAALGWDAPSRTRRRGGRGHLGRPVRLHPVRPHGR